MFKNYTTFTLAALSFLCIFVGQQTTAMDALDALGTQFMQEQKQKLLITEMFKELLAINPKLTAEGSNTRRYKEAITRVLKKHDMYNKETVEHIHAKLFGDPYQFAKEQGLEKYTEVENFDAYIKSPTLRILNLEILRDIEEGK